MKTKTKLTLAVALATIVAVVLSGQAVFPMLVAGACLAGLLLLHVPGRLLLLRLAPPLGIAAVICLLRPFYIDGEPILTIPVAGRELTATRAGLLDGLLIACRVLGAVSAMLLLSMTTPAHRIFAVLQWAHLPRTLVETAMLMYRYIFSLLEHASDAVSAARIRLGFSSARKALSSMGLVAGAVLTRSMEQAERTHEAMVCRGYRGELPLGHLGPLSPAGRLALVAGAGAVACIYLLLEFGLN